MGYVVSITTEKCASKLNRRSLKIEPIWNNQTISGSNIETDVNQNKQPSKRRPE